MAKINKKSKYKKLERKFESSWWFILPLMFIVAVVPLISYMKIVNIEGFERLNWKGDTSVDFFSYYKSVYFTVATFVSFIILFILKITGQCRFKKSKYYIPLGVYLIFVLLSFLFSKYDVVAWRGFVDMFQGVWVLLGYGIVVIACMNFIQNEKHVKMLVGSYIFIGLVTAVIGLGQYFGHDIFKTDFGKYLLLPENYHHLAENLKFTFGEKTIYATLYNTNYVGSFAVIFVFISISMFIYAKGLKQVLTSGVFTALMVALLVGSNSRAGMIGFVLGIIFVVLLFRKNIIRNIKKIAVVLTIGIIAIFVLNSVSEGAVLREIKSMNFLKELAQLKEKESKTVRIEDVIFDEDIVEIVTENESLKIKHRDNDLLFADSEGNLLETKVENNVITFIDEVYARYKVTREDENDRFILNVYNQKMKIYYADDGLRMLGSGGVLSRTQYPERLEFMDGYEKFASTRGYIWSRSVPILKDTMFIGYGPDTFAMVFPQKDYVGKMNAFNNEAMIVDKPHNMYLQIGINTGVVSLVALLALFFMYIVDSIRLYWKKDIVTFLDHIGIGCVTGMIAYLGAGFFNDQVISVAPLFYVLIGMGIAINRIVRN
jgi:hypothetical protein